MVSVNASKEGDSVALDTTFGRIETQATLHCNLEKLCEMGVMFITHVYIGLTCNKIESLCDALSYHRRDDDGLFNNTCLHRTDYSVQTYNDN